MIYINRIEKYRQMRRILNEKQWRQYIALEIKSGMNIEEVSQEAKISKNTIKRGIRELEVGDLFLYQGRIRQRGGGRKKIIEKDTSLLSDLDRLFDPQEDSGRLFCWTVKDVSRLSEDLRKQGHLITDTSLRQILHSHGYTCRVSRKAVDESLRTDYQKQCEYIVRQCHQFELRENPILSLCGKRKELAGSFTKNNHEWQMKGSDVSINVHDYISLAPGDYISPEASSLFPHFDDINMSVTQNTAEFAVESIKRWWQISGQDLYPERGELLVIVDGNDTLGAKKSLWISLLQEFANMEQMTISVVHYPPVISKWNRAERQLFSCVSIDWQATPLISLAMILEQISHPAQQAMVYPMVKCTTTSSIHIREKGDDFIIPLNLIRDSFHGEWNYMLRPC